MAAYARRENLRTVRDFSSLGVASWQKEELGFSVSFSTSEVKLYLVGSDMDYEGGGEFIQVDEQLPGRVTGSLDYLLGKRIMAIEKGLTTGRTDKWSGSHFLGGSALFDLHLQEGEDNSIFALRFQYQDGDSFYPGFPDVYFTRNETRERLILCSLD